MIGQRQADTPVLTSVDEYLRDFGIDRREAFN
jgi:hypothetical protein